MDAHTIALVKERADIVQIIGEHVQLRASGQGYKGLCPFHQEKTPSFTVNAARGFFHCFGCGKGGSVVDFVMERQGMEFREALCWLAERVGVEISSGSSGKDRGQADRSAEALRLATEIYHQQLINEPSGEESRTYLRNRGFQEEDWCSFKIGAAWDDWQGLLSRLSGKLDKESILKSGLVGKSKSGRIYDWMRARVVFPIQDVSGYTIGFGGRLIKDDASQPKYINTPETVHYRKHRVLFGLPQAIDAWNKSKRALLVEGYLDVLRMHQHGFSESVASCGTSLTVEHVAFIKRHVKEVLLLFDGDAAGVRAVTRSAAMLLESELDVQVVSLPDKLDPDDILQQRGSSAMHQALENAKPLLEYLAWATFQQFPQSIQGKQQTLKSLADTLQVAKPTTRALAIRHLADLLGLDTASVQSQMKSSSKLQKAYSHSSSSHDSIVLPSITEREKRIFALLAWHSSLAGSASTLLQPGDFSSEMACSVFKRLISSPADRLGADSSTAENSSSQAMNHTQQEELLLRTILAEKPLHVQAAENPEAALRAEIYYLKRPRLLELRRAWLKALNTPQAELAHQRWKKAERSMANLKPSRNTYQPPAEWCLREPSPSIPANE